MKAVIINGSPRAKGNSDLLCDEFIRGAKESGHQTEKISLREYSVNPCKACYACFKTGKCIQKDDMPEILNKVKNADVLLLASPTYFLTMSGQMKIFIDRLLPEWQGLGGKEVYIIVTGHDRKEGLKRTANDLKDIFAYLGNTVKPVIWSEGVWQKGEVIGTKAMDEAYLAGKNIGK
ncbi:MAG: flavodoxin family protein [Eubacterium sp.]|nr:flavodoxin family protein [Eubacterium sp.]MCC8097763.1 flavodoxin family protein [Eubacterium sp.]